jgi:hypothetical protein
MTSPGPWRVLGHEILAANNGIVALVNPRPEKSADRRLIAAAPELLAALKLWLSSGLGTNPEHLALIARVEGEP